MSTNWWDKYPEMDAKPANSGSAPVASTAAPAANTASAGGDWWDKYEAYDTPQAAAPAEPKSDVGVAKGLGMGVLRGAKDVIDTGAKALASGFDKIAGTSEGQRVEAMNKAGRQEFDENYKGSTAASVGRVAGQVAATLPVGGFIGQGVRAAGAAGLAPSVAVPLGQAIASGGLSAGGAGMATRVAGGAISGGAAAGLVDPDSAGTGAVIGAVLPASVNGAAKTFAKLGQAMRGSPASSGVRKAAEAGREAGFVVPPTQVEPSFRNRLLEGMAGKLTTAQNASSRNQEVTNKLAMRSIGAEELTSEGIAAVRARANQAYNALGQAGSFSADLPFKAQLRKIGASSQQLKTDFPELAKADVDKLVSSMAEKSSFDAQSGIEAIKRLRADARANRMARDNPDRQALGKVQNKISAALEDLIDRNLQRSGNTQLLADYRAARTTLAKAFDVEAALNPITGNVDGAKLAQLLKKGRPLTGELKQAAEFASAFPKATQTPERMGSLPQLSPLDWFAALGATAATGAGAAGVAGLAARPLARAAALSGPVQRSLTASAAKPQLRLSARDRLGNLEYLTPGLAAGLSGRDQ